MDDVIDRRVHMVSLLTVLITQTFLVRHSGNFERSPRISQFLDLIIGSLVYIT